MMEKEQLQTEQNTPEMELRVMAAAIRLVQFPDGHARLRVEFEHGQWWIICNNCGAVWSVNDATGPGTIDGFCVEQVSDGDESCARGR